MAATTDVRGNIPYRPSPPPLSAPTSRGDASFLPRVSWPGVFAGVVVVLVVDLMLSVLGLGIGASTIDPLHERNPAAGVPIGAGLWFVGSALIALFAGGCTAGRLGGMVRHMDGALHGILAWGLSTLLTVYLLTTAIGGVLSGFGNALGSGLSAAGSGISATVAGAGQIAGGTVSAQDTQEAKDVAQRLVQSGGTLSEADKNSAVDAMVARTGQSRERRDVRSTAWSRPIAPRSRSSTR